MAVLSKLKEHRDLMAFALIALATGYGLYLVQEQSAHTLYVTQLEACERGNVLRAVVFANTTAAEAQAVPGSDAEKSFATQLATLRDTPYKLPDGTVECALAIPEP